VQFPRLKKAASLQEKVIHVIRHQLVEVCTSGSLFCLDCLGERARDKLAVALLHHIANVVSINS